MRRVHPQAYMYSTKIFTLHLALRKTLRYGRSEHVDISRGIYKMLSLQVDPRRYRYLQDPAHPLHPQHGA